MAFTAGSNTTNIRMGTCAISYNGLDLGYTIGGVEVEVSTSTKEIKVDQFGDVVANEYIMGRQISVKVPMAEVTLDNMVSVMPGATLVQTGGSFSTGTITIATNPVDGETILVNGMTVTFKTGTASAALNQVLVGAAATDTAGNLRTFLNASPDTRVSVANYTGSTAVTTVTYYKKSTAGNSFTLVTGTAAAKVTMSAATLTGGATPTAEKVEVETGTGISLLALATELVLHPIALAAGDKSEDLVIPLAAAPGAMSFAYKYDEERVFMAEFKGYPDANGVLFIYGDKTATA